MNSSPHASSHAPPFNPNQLDEAALLAALRGNEHVPVLQAFFGPDVYAELRELALRAEQVTPDRQLPKVYVLPGLLGSKLGIKKPHGTELLWMDPPSVIGGKLAQLAIGKRRSLRCVGTMLPGYLKLKLMLHIAGFEVELHAYDWRRSARELAREFAARLEADSAQEVMIVAHSMGGLVARAALKFLAGAKVSRLVQLGTPNQGSYALVQALRACYPTMRKLGAVDCSHTAEQLAQLAFNGFYSLYEMVPPPRFTPGLNLFDAKQWPQDELRPHVERLKLGRRLQRHLVAADRRCHVIAGVNQLTATGISIRNGEFVYQFSMNGDGTVALPLAHWQGAQHWYVEEAHGQLPRNSEVCAAIIDLLKGETTMRLPSEWRTSNTVTSERSEHELHQVLNGKVRWDQLPMNERRDLLEPVISPVFASLCYPLEDIDAVQTTSKV